MPSLENIWFWLLLAAIAGFVLHYVLSAGGRKELTRLRSLLDQKNQERQALERQLTDQRIDLERKNVQTQHAEERLRNLKEDAERSELRFKALADQIFQEKSNRFTQASAEKLDAVLNPLKERIQHFEQQLQNSHKDSIAQNSRLRQELRQIQELNQQMSVEARNLTRALKGDQKAQGNWGEIVLERVLEKSGLEKGREYTTQTSYPGPDGRRLQPDVVIHLPDQKTMIVDAKVSLVAYERMMSATNQEERDKNEQAHLASVRRHIKQLSDKNYHHLLESSPDFVLLFIPIETAFAQAVAVDKTLYSDAFERNIILVSPTTLLATLRTIDTLWTYDRQRRHSLEIATEAGRMYDKFQGLLSDLEQIDKRMFQTRAAYDKAINKLSTGSGNLLGKAEKLKKLGAKTRKSMSQKWLGKKEEE